MACGFWFNFGGQTCTDLNIGAGRHRDACRRHESTSAVRALRCRWSRQRSLAFPTTMSGTVVADTSTLGHNDMTDGSRGTFSSSMATIFAARNAIKVMRERAAQMWDIPVDNVVWEDGHAKAKAKKHGNLAPLSLKEIAAAAANTGGPIAGHQEIVADGAGVSFATHICDIEVDPETGATEILRYTVVQDAGKAVHPSYVEGQFQGGAAQGIGWALNEEYIYGEGWPLAESRLPRLPHPGVFRPADDRHADPRDPQPQPPLWRARCGRDLDRAAAGGHCQRSLQRGWSSHVAHSNFAATHFSCIKWQRRQLMVDVTLWAGLRPFADNQNIVSVEARTIRELLRKLEARYPGLREPIRGQVAVSVNGVIYRDDWSKELPEGAEVMLMRRLAGG